MSSKKLKETVSAFIGSARAAIAFLCVIALSLTLTGCATPQAQQQEGEDAEKPLTSSEYMAQVNLSVDKLNERLESFVDAVSREDTVTMRIQADSAFAVLDEMAAIEAPEELKDLRTDYINGCDKLKDALSSYVELYTEISTAQTGNTFDYSTYADRIKEVQDKYNEGVQDLEDADKQATEL